ncbi:protein Exd1 homolog [Sitodiplosis mosellana]|uniref:protein Exd1 homolog n=1 Tax=Sitodiplosis mosellana TaxID=263140 RepID=UPI002443DB0F|nr:protein Exd1 homolog [Sitodiplosis mosellana]
MAKKPLELDDKILIELNGGRCVTCDYIRESKDGIVVRNSKEAGSEKIAPYNQTFYKTEVKRVRLIQKATPPATQDNAIPSTSQQQQNVLSANNNATGAIPKSPHVETVVNGTVVKKEFNERGIEEIQHRTRNTVHIAQHDDKYHNAIKDLKQQEIIAVHSESKFGRLDMKRPVLSISTTANVYIFDMLRLGAMKKEMKEVMSSDLPRKVVHGSSGLADYLQHKENCALNNVFDTLLVDFNLKKSHEYITLPECYMKYFELPDDFVLQSFDYSVRPLPKNALIRAALNSILLMKLYWHMNDILLKPIFTASKEFAKIYPNVEHQVDLMMMYNNKEHPGSEEIELNAMEHLNTELQLLDVKQ